MTERTTVHVMRHGEVFNPTKVLYGRLPGFELSDLGHRMAERVVDFFKDRDITHIAASPLTRAQQTAAPTSRALGIPVVTDDNLIEALNVFEGKRVSVGDGALRDPKNWPLLWNPWRPSWGEPYVDIAARMRLAISAARDAAAGHEAMCVSHQLPIWIARLDAEQRSFIHWPTRRQCTLASVTSFVFEGERLVDVYYNEPAGDLLPGAAPGTGA